MSKKELSKELADVVGMAIVNAHLLNIDLEDAIDRKWINKVVTLEGWKDEFVKPGKHDCKFIKNYSEYKPYRRSMGKEYCYIVRAPMYYFIPSHLEDVGEHTPRTDWTRSSLNTAKNGFRKGYKINTSF